MSSEKRDHPTDGVGNPQGKILADVFLGPEGSTISKKAGFDFRAVWTFMGNGDRVLPNHNPAPTWKALSTALDLTDGHFSFHCGKDGLCTDCSEDPKSFQVMVRFPNLFQQRVDIGGSSSDSNPSYGDVTMDVINNQFSNLVKRPWTWNPPGGLCIHSYNLDTVNDPLGGQFVYTFQNHESTKRHGNWSNFESYVPFADEEPNILGWNGQNQRFPGTLKGTVAGVFQDELRMDMSGATVNVPRPTSLTKFVPQFPTKDDIYKVFKNMASKGDQQNSGAFEKNFPNAGPTAIGMTINIYLVVDETNLYLNSAFRKIHGDRYNDGKSIESTKILKWVDDGSDPIDGGVNPIHQLIHDMANGQFFMPVDLNVIKGSGSGVQSFDFVADFTFLYAGGVYSQKATARYNFKLRYSDISGVNSNVTTDSIDWRTTINSAASNCINCPKVVCDGGQPSVATAGTCATLFGGQFDIERDSIRLLKNYKDAVGDALESQSSTIESIKALVDGIQRSPGYATLSDVDKRKFLSLTITLNKLTVKIAKVNQTLSAILGDISNADGDDYLEKICQVINSSTNVEKVHTEIATVYDELKQAFAQLQTDIDSIPGIGDVGFSGGEFDIATDIPAIEAALAFLEDKMDNETDSADNATDGVSDDTKLDGNLPANEAVANTTDTKASLPKWAIYTITIVIVLVVIAISVGTWWALRKKARGF